jgi:glucose-6-phosphate dehydrogenase assembly protein OpcA
VRTSIFNLVIYAQDENAARRLADDLTHFAGRHPSRAVILTGDRTQPVNRVDADVSVYCRFPSPDLPALGYEQVLVKGLGRAADHLASVALPLLVPELPTYLWWPGQPPFGHRVLHRFLTFADTLIIDSAQFDSPGDGFANVAWLSQGTQGVNDFNWGRLTTWREIIAQFFDGPQWQPYAFGVRSLSLDFGSGASDYRQATSGTLLMLGWVASRLGWKPETTLDGVLKGDMTMSILQGDRVVPIQLRLSDRGAEAAGKLMRVELVSQPKGLQPARFVVDRSDDLERVRVTMQIHGDTDIARTVPLDRKTDMQLLADELDLSGPDLLYKEVVDMASRLAGREVWVPA